MQFFIIKVFHMLVRQIFKAITCYEVLYNVSFIMLLKRINNNNNVMVIFVLRGS